MWMRMWMRMLRAGGVTLPGAGVFGMQLCLAYCLIYVAISRCNLRRKRWRQKDVQRDVQRVTDTQRLALTHTHTRAHPCCLSGQQETEMQLVWSALKLRVRLGEAARPAAPAAPGILIFGMGTKKTITHCNTCWLGQLFSHKPATGVPRPGGLVNVFLFFLIFGLGKKGGNGQLIHSPQPFELLPWQT